MNSTSRDDDRMVPRAVPTGADGPAPRREPGSAEIRDVMADVQNLLGQLTHVADPEIARVRAKLADTLHATKRAVAKGTQRVQRQSKEAMRAGDDYVRERPWQAVSVAALVGVLIGILVARR